MVRLVFIEANGEVETIDARPDQSLMEAAVKNGVRGIAGDCGGSAACGTCRIYPKSEWPDRLGEMRAIERDMLDCTEDGDPSVRLACQVSVTAALDGLVVRLPESQHWS